VATVAQRIDVFYPEENGQPVAETERHVRQLFDLFSALRIRYSAAPDVYVACDLFLYYEEGNPQAVVAPDLMVVRGVRKEPMRRVYKLWEEGQAPCWVIEVTSRASQLVDLGTKRAVYALLGVPEYFIFDPLGEYLDPPLLRYRLLPGQREYQRTDGLRLESAALGLTLVVEEGWLRLYDSASGARLLTPEEEAQARQAAEAELARLRAELERWRGPS